MSTITRYEITATHQDGRTWLVGYTPRYSRAGLLNAMRKVGADLVDRLAIGDSDTMAWGTKPRPYCMTSGWLIAFSGRTQLDARMQGPHRFIGEASQ